MTHAIRPVDFDNLKTMTYEVTDRVARITFNRPEKGNAIIADTPLELSALVERADLDEQGQAPESDEEDTPAEEPTVYAHPVRLIRARSRAMADATAAELRRGIVSCGGPSRRGPFGLSCASA